MNNINKDIKSGELKNVYLMYGEEAYLIKEYRDKLYSAVIPDGAEAFNYTFFEGKECSAAAIADACETMPFMNDKRLVIAKNTELFVSGRKDEAEKMADYINEISDSCILVFIEDKADKRGRLYKAVAKKGYCAEFGKMKENDLISFVMELFRAEKIAIGSDAVVYFIRAVGSDMNNLKKEAEKLFAYRNDGGRVTREDIDLICTKSLEAVIFELVGAIGKKNAQRAIEIYTNMLTMKEQPLMILAMIARQFRMIIQCKYLLKQRMSVDAMCSALGIRSFMARDYMAQSENFTNKVLISAINDCLECDINIKTGKITDRLGVELIIIKYAS